jgi:uncharacterized protein (TIGR02996 family)
MPDQIALLNLIIDHPDDDLPRLILADWLEDRNAPGDRACSGFIRVQCELAHLGIGDPRRPELEATERALAPRHPRRWAKPIRRFVRSWSYGRGLIEGVKISRQNLMARAEELFSAAPIQRLELRLEEGIAKALLALPQISRIRGLTLFSCDHFSAEETRRLLGDPLLGGLRELTLVDLSHSVVGWLVVAPWRNCIETLDLRFPFQRGSGSNPLQLPALRVLRLHMPYHHMTYPAFALPALRSLEVRCLCGTGGIAGMLSRIEAPHLEELILDGRLLPGAELRPADVTAMLSRLEGKPLRSLALAGWRLRRQAVETLLAHPLAQQLTRLRLGDVDDQGVRALAASPLRELRTLHLEGQEVPGMTRALSALSTLFESALAQQLEILGLWGMGVGKTALLRMQASPLRWRLWLLDLQENLLDDQACQCLPEFDSWPRLLCLNVQDAGLDSPMRSWLRRKLGERLQY